jgi:hypothetical protein
VPSPVPHQFAPRVFQFLEERSSLHTSSSTVCC